MLLNDVIVGRIPYFAGLTHSVAKLSYIVSCVYFVTFKVWLHWHWHYFKFLFIRRVY